MKKVFMFLAVAAIFVACGPKATKVEAEPIVIEEEVIIDEPTFEGDSIAIDSLAIESDSLAVESVVAE